MSSDMEDTELDRILGKYAEILMEHFKRVVVQGDLTVVPAKETLRSELQRLIKRETDKAHQEGYKKGYINAGIEALNG